MHRRTFLGSSLAGLAALSFSDSLAAQQKKGKKASGPAVSSQPLDSLFLTWQQDPTTTMTLQWVGPAGGGTTIHYSPLATDDWKTAQAGLKPYPGTEMQVQRCELTNLAPGTEYIFRIGDAQSDLRFRTMPAKATDTIQWVSGGDCGIDAHAIGTNIIAAKQEPYFALIAGDLAYDNGESPLVFLKFLQNYRQHMVDPQGRLIPLVTCIGNHEVKSRYNGKRDEAGSYLSLFDGLFRDTTYNVLDFGDYLSLVLLDTEHIAPIAGEQTSWLAKTLAERQDRPHLIVANHVPAYPSYRAPDNVSGNGGTGYDQRRLWAPLFEKFNVDVVLEHHDHTFKRTHPLKGGHVDRHGVIYLGDGSWGKLRVPKTPEDRPYLAKVSEAYHLTVHRLEGEQRFHVALEETGKVADVCMTVSKRPARRG
jgi:acid phosphatase type 7